MMRLGIAGTGLVGGSIALRARAGGATVIAYDADPAALVRARERGAIDTIAIDLRELAAQCDTLVIALPVDATREALHALAGMPPGILPELTIDVASVKAAIAAGPVPAHFVGTHPMAGRERGGIDAADPALFAGATWAYVPPAEGALEPPVRAFIEAMGALPLPVDATRHDEIVALTSHLPQALSVLLGAQLAAASDGTQVKELCGPGMMSMLRLARSPESVWAPIVAANARPLAEQMHAFARTLMSVARGLEQGDISGLMAYFGDARRSADALEERLSTPARSSPYQ